MPKILTAEAPLMNYAAWYAMRYMPSFRKLQEALLKKTWGNVTLANTVAGRMQEYISEERTVDGLVRMYLDQGKTIEYTKTKLRDKKFDSEVIAQVFLEYQEGFDSWNTYADIVERKILGFISKNKSKQYIRGALLQKYPTFKAEIAELLDIHCSDETESIHQEFEKLRKKHDIANQKERQKLTQKLCMKGFSYDAVRRIIEAEA